MPVWNEVSLLFKFLDDKECFQRPSVTKTLQKYYNFVTFERKYCEKDAGVVILKRTCGFQDDCFEHQCGWEKEQELWKVYKN